MKIKNVINRWFYKAGTTEKYYALYFEQTNKRKIIIAQYWSDVGNRFFNTRHRFNEEDCEWVEE